jgi:tripartite-type tricarboxylate transporter receptor subunit TctC
MIMPLRSRSTLAFALSIALSSPIALSQSAYPLKPVRVIVPFTPGAGADIVARTVTPRLTEATGQSFLVDNRGGAGGIIGTEAAARAAPDGYTLYVGGTALIVTPLLGKVPFSARDFAPASRIASVPFILVVHPTMPVKTLRDLVALAKAKPGAINYASTGNGTTPHLTTAMFQHVAKIDITHVPYKGSGPALADLLGGHVDMFFCNLLSATPHVASGRLRPLAISSAHRSPIARDVPTVAESGYPGFETGTWFGLMAPAGTPEPVIAKLRSEVQKAVRRADVQSELAGQGAAAMIDNAPDDMARYMKSETEKWAKVIDALALRAH